MKTASNLEKRRKELGLTLEQVGKVCGVSKSTVKKWETGLIENMKRDKIPLLAKALKVDIDFIFEENETPTSENEDKRKRLYDEIVAMLNLMDEEQLKRFQTLMKYAKLSNEDFERLEQLAEIAKLTL